MPRLKHETFTFNIPIIIREVSLLIDKEGQGFPLFVSYDF